jgi:hypothetical protein
LLLVAAELPAGSSSLWVTADDIDLILYLRDADQAEQLHAIAHQAAHIFLGHQATAANITPSLFPHLAPDFAAATVMISRFSEADELAADNLASRIVANTAPAEITAGSPDGRK